MKYSSFTKNSTLRVAKASFVGKNFYKMIKKNVSKQFGNGESKGENEFTKIIDAMLEDMPNHQLVVMSNGALTPAVMEGLVDMMNGHYIRGAKKIKK